MHDADDAELLEAWRAGDKEAAGLLLQRHFKSVYRFFATKVDDRVDDLVQRTFLAAVEGHERIHDASKFRPYLLGIARYELITYLKDKLKAGQQVLDSAIPDVAVTPTALVARRQEQQLLLRALRRLPLSLQITVGLHYFEGMKIADIAQTVGSPEGTVKYRLSEARDRLRRQVEALAGSTALAESTLGGLETWLRGLEIEV